MWTVGDMLDFIGKSSQFYTHGRWYQLLSYDFNTQTYIISDDSGSVSHAWDMLIAHGYFNRVNTAAYTHPVTTTPPYPQRPQAGVSSGVQTLVPGGSPIYWESIGTEQSPTPTVETRNCTPKEYEGFTERYFYCTRCDRKSEDECYLITSTCDK